MKKFNFRRLTTVLLMAFTAVFAGCNNEDVDFDTAYLEITPGSLSYEEGGEASGTGSFSIKTNRKWTITQEDKNVDWIALSKSEGNGDTDIKVSLLPNTGESRSTRLIVKASINTEYITIRQTGSLVTTELYNLKFGVGAPSSGSYPYLDEWIAAGKDLQESGEGRSTVTLEGSSVSLRQSGRVSSGYEGASGENKLFFSSNASLTVNTISTGGATNFKVTFGVAHYLSGNNNFTYDKFELFASSDGTNYTSMPYTVDPEPVNGTGAPDWYFATARFDLPNSGLIYVRFVANEASSLSLDDVTVTATSGGGETGPTVRTTAATGITASSAVVGGTYAPATPAPTQAGVEWKTGSGPFQRKMVEGAISTPFTVTLTGLTNGATYTYRAFATIEGQTVYGSEMTFVAKDGGDPGPVGDELYLENVGTKVEKDASDKWPNVDVFTDWSRGGTLTQSGVTYSGSSASVRNSGGSYEPSGSEASGAPYVFLGSGTPNFQISSINISGHTNFTFKMNVSFQESYSGGPVFGAITPSSFKIEASVDGTKWTQLTFAGGAAAKWVPVSAGFRTPSGSTTLYIKISEPSVASNYRFDDFAVVSGGGDSGPMVGDGDDPGPQPGGEIFSESFGTAEIPATKPKVGEYTGYDNYGTLTFSDEFGTADIRKLSASTNHLWLPAYKDGKGASLAIGNIDAAGVSDMVLTFELAANLYSAGEEINQNVVKIDFDGTTFTLPSKVLTNADNNKFIEHTVNLTGVTGTATSTLKFYTGEDNNKGMRIDNVKLEGEGGGPTPGTLTFSQATFSGNLVVGSAASGTITVPYANASGQSYSNVTVDMTGAGAAGLSVSGGGTVTLGTNGNVTFSVSGTPTTAGSVTFTINGITELTAPKNAVTATVRSAGGGGDAFLEDFGTLDPIDPSAAKLEYPKYKIGEYTGYSMGSPITYSDPHGTSADIRSTTTLNGNAHLWLPKEKECGLKIDGIPATSGKTLKYGIATNAASQVASTIQVKCNGTAVTVPSTSIPYSTSAITFLDMEITLPDGTTSIEFYSGASANTAGFRIDNIKIE